MDSSQKIVYVDAPRVMCTGTIPGINHSIANGHQTSATADHPKVYLEMGHNTQVICSYCHRLYILSATASVDAHVPGATHAISFKK